MIGQSFDPRHNSLNFLRLALAVTVVVTHAFQLGGFSSLSFLNGTTPGVIAVYGFFGMGGFLITGSATHNGAGRYLWQRCIRIFPAFWVCLIVTGFVLGSILWLRASPAHCDLACYLDPTQSGPFSYVYANSFLKINQILVFPRDPVYFLANFPLWTLFWEFLCYLLLLSLALFGWLRNRQWTASVTAGLWATLFVITLAPGLPKATGAYDFSVLNFLKLAPIFMVGAVIYLYRERVPDSGWIALACAGLFMGSLWLPTGPGGGASAQFYFSASDLLSPLIAYPLLWLGIHLPFQKVGSRNDYSYGTYIYSWPVTQVLLAWKAQRWGVGVFVILIVLGTAPLAAASWWIIEKRALRLKKFSVAEWRSRRETERLPAEGPAL